MDVSGWSEYVRRVTRGQTQAQVAARTGIAQSNIGRWLRGEGGQPKPDYALTLAKAYGQPPAEALIAAGYLTESDVAVQRTPLSAFAFRELIDELHRRNPED